MTSSSAILLTMLVPGLPHVLLGRTLRAILAFVLTVGMFFLGYSMVEDRLLACILFEPFAFLENATRIAPLNLLPEFANLGCSIVAALMRDLPSNPEQLNEALRMGFLPRPNEHLGFFLTGSSGIVACFWAADAQWLALKKKNGKANPSLMAAISWLLPGTGHYFLGQKSKGLLMGAAVLILFVMGLLLAAGNAVDRGLHPAYWIPESLFGGGSLFAALVTGPWRLTEPLPHYYSLGITLCSVAGLLNLVVMIDAYTVAERPLPDDESVVEGVTA